MTGSGYVGPPMHGVGAEVRVPAGDTTLGEGVGRFFVRSASMMAGYLADGALDSSMLHEGWFETGDVARIDPAAASTSRAA